MYPAVCEQRIKCHKPIVGLCLLILLLAGCGTTRQTETPRTATEMLLISNAVDETVGQFDLSYLVGKDVFFDTTYLDTTVDKGYVISSIRQHMMASGVKLVENFSSGERANCMAVGGSSVFIACQGRFCFWYGTIPLRNDPTRHLDQWEHHSVDRLVLVGGARGNKGEAY